MVWRTILTGTDVNMLSEDIMFYTDKDVNCPFTLTENGFRLNSSLIKENHNGGMPFQFKANSSVCANLTQNLNNSKYFKSEILTKWNSHWACNMWGVGGPQVHK